MKFTVLHKDHGISDAQFDHIFQAISAKRRARSRFLLVKVTIPAELGSVPCGLHGPAMGDDPISDSEVEYLVRGNDDDPRTWADRMCSRPTRPVNYVQAIGMVSKAGDACTLFTVYGGPLSPQNPDDPNNNDPQAAREFWAQHALSK